MTSNHTRRLGVGLIGVGWMGRLHTRAYRALREQYADLGVQPELVVAADPVQTNRDDAVDRLGYTAATADYREVLAKPEVDVVSICSPNFLHRELALAEVARHGPGPRGRDPDQRLSPVGLRQTHCAEVRARPRASRRRDQVGIREPQVTVLPRRCAGPVSGHDLRA